MKRTDRDLQWEAMRTEHIERSAWIDFMRQTYRLPDGRVAGEFYRYSRYRDYVVIAAADEEGRYLAVRQFRPGIGAVTTEFPAGGMERTDGGFSSDDAEDAGGDGGVLSAAGNDVRDGGVLSCAALPQDEESALLAAKRELAEETGYVSERWTHLLTVPSDATICANYAHLFLAEDCRRAGEQHLDDTEFLNVLRLTRDELEERIFTGRFQQAVHVMAYLLAVRKKPEGRFSGFFREGP